MNAIATQKYNGLDINIYNCPIEDPRKEYEHSSMIYTNTGRYNPDGASIEDIMDYDDEGRQYLKLEGHHWAKIYACEHGQIALRVSDSNPFANKWDSYLFGIIAIEDGPCTREKALEVFKNEVEEYECYLNGEGYMYEIEKEGEVIASCRGYLSIEEAQGEAIVVADEELLLEEAKEDIMED